MSTAETLKDMVQGVVDTLEELDKHGSSGEYEDIWEFLQEGVLSIERYIFSGGMDFMGARLLVSYGGPNIYIDTERSVVEGYWGSNEVVLEYDSLSFNDTVHEGYELS